MRRALTGAPEALPTEPGLYENSLGDVWMLRDDGQWQSAGRRLPFGGIALEPADPEHTADAKTLERIDRPYGGTLPLTPVHVAEVPRWLGPPPPTGAGGAEPP